METKAKSETNARVYCAEIAALSSWHRAVSLLHSAVV